MSVLLERATSKLVGYPQFLDRVFSEDQIELMAQAKSLPLLERPAIVVYSKEVRQNRNVGFFSDEEIAGYRYSGQVMSSQPLACHPILRRLLRRVNRELGTQFNAILVNQYCTGEQSIGAHSDDLRDLEPGHPITSISIGATRTFRIRTKANKAIALDYPHRSGTLLVMEGEFQNDFTHEIPKQLKVASERISFTFRRHVA